MKSTNYKLPLSLSRFFTEDGGQYLEQTTEVESIDQFLGLLLTTRYGEHGFDHKFGTQLSDLDFENIISRSKWEDKFIDYVMEAIVDNEKRLKDITVEINMRDVMREEISMEGYSVRKRVDIVIQGVVVSSGKRHGFMHVLYLGPLSSV